MIVKWNTDVPTDNEYKLVKISNMVPDWKLNDPKYAVARWVNGWMAADGSDVEYVIGWADLIEEAPVEVAYLCDCDDECANASGGCMAVICPDCHHTTDINHAVNFKKVETNGLNRFVELRYV